MTHGAQELCESRDGSPGLRVPNGLYGLCGRKATLNMRRPELSSCVKIEVDVQGSPSLMVFMVSVDVERNLKKIYGIFRAQELCGSRGGHPVLPVPNSRYGICGR